MNILFGIVSVTRSAGLPFSFAEIRKVLNLSSNYDLFETEGIDFERPRKMTAPNQDTYTQRNSIIVTIYTEKRSTRWQFFHKIPTPRIEWQQQSDWLLSTRLAWITTAKLFVSEQYASNRYTFAATADKKTKTAPTNKTKNGSPFMHEERPAGWCSKLEVMALFCPPSVRHVFSWIWLLNLT